MARISKARARRRAERAQTLYREIAHRMRTVRIILGLSEQQAADEFAVALRTYRRYEEGAPQRFASPLYCFAEKYGVEAWLCSGCDGTSLDHRYRSGKVVILPMETIESQRVKARLIARFGRLPGEAPKAPEPPAAA